MTQQIINIGTSPNDKSGDPLRSAFIKINANFTELYATTSADVQIPTQSNNGGKYLTTNGTILSWGSISTTTNQLVNGAHTVTVGSDGYLTVESLYVQGYLKGVDGSTGSTGQVLTRQSNGGVAWANATGGTVDRLVNGDFNFILGPDGTVNFDPSSANGKGILQTAADLQFIAVDKTWTFGTDGNLTIPNNGTIADSNSYLTTLNLYVQGSLKGVDGSTGTTGQILTRQSNGGIAWANLAALPYVKSTFTGGTATLDIFTATWVNSVAIRPQISVSNTVNVTLQYTATSIIAGTTTSTNGGGMWTQTPSGGPFSSNNLDNLGDIQVMYLQDITNQKIYRITGMNTAGSVNPAQGSVLIERII